MSHPAAAGLADNIRVTLHEAIVRQRTTPAAVFMTSISAAPRVCAAGSSGG